MKTIAIANQKDGVGKTTIVRNPTFFAIERGLRVLHVDLDPQKSFSKTLRALRERTVGDQGNELQSLTGSVLFGGEAIELQPLPCGESIALVTVDRELMDMASHPPEDPHTPRATLAELAKDFSVCIIGTAPTLGNPLYVALIAADLVMYPCTTDQDAIDGLGDLFEDIVRVQQLEWNANLATLGLLTNRVNTRRTSDRDTLEQLRDELDEVAMEGVLYGHTATQYTKDRSMWCVQNGESQILAAREIKAVRDQIFGKVAI